MTEIDQTIPPDLQEVKETLERSGFWMRPLVFLEEELTYREELENIKLRTIGFSYQRDITNAFFLDILEAFKHNQIFSAAVLGTPGFGKTKVMLAIAVHIQEVQKNIQHLETPPLIQTAIGKNESMKAVKKLDSNMIFIQDEDPFTSGIDSLTSEHALQNILEIVLRFHKIPYLTAAVSRKRGMVKNYFSCYIEPISRNDTERITICRILSGRTLLPLGHIRIKVLSEDHPIQFSHNQKEARYKTQLLSKGGYESVSIDPNELEKRSHILLHSVLGFTDLTFKNLTEKQKLMIRRLRIERLKTAMRKLAYDFPGSSDQHKRVIDETWDILDKTQMLINIDREERKIKEKQQQESQEKQRKQEEQEKQSQEKELERQQQHNLIHQLVDLVIEYFFLTQENVNIRLIKHYLEKKGVNKEYLNYALGEIEERVFLLQKEEEKREKDQILTYQVNLDSDKFLFDNNAFLNDLATKPKRSPQAKSWDLKVKVYLAKTQDSTIDQIVKKFNISSGSASNYYNEVSGEIARVKGLQYEAFRAAKLQEKFPNAEIQVAQENDNQSDITLKLDNKTEFHSLKLRRLPKSKATETFRLLQKCGPEYKAAKRTNSIMLIDFYNEENHTHSTKIVDLVQVTEKTKIRLKYTGELEIDY